MTDAFAPGGDGSRLHDRPGPPPGEGSAEAVASAGVRLAASISGCQPVGIFLTRAGEVVLHDWHGPDDGARVELAGLLRQVRPALANPTTPSGPVRLPTSGGRTFRLFDLRARGESLGTLCVAEEIAPGNGPPERADGALAQLAGLLASQICDLREIGRLTIQRVRDERWFKTLDQQLAVLDRERQKFTAVVGQPDTYVFVTDLARRLRWTNAAMAEFLAARHRAEWIGTECRQVCLELEGRSHGEECGSCPVRRVLELNQVAHQELRHASGGSVRNLYLTALPIRSPDGRPTEVLVMLQDLTGLEVLRRSESRYRLLFERSANAIVMVHPGTQRIVLANATARRTLGYPEPALRQRALSDLHSPAEWARVEPLYARVLTDPRPESFECALRGRSGEERQAVAWPTRFDLDGEEVMLLEFLDVTERRRAEDALREREAQLRQAQKMEAVGRLAGGVAHDFNNLLTVISGRTQMLLRGQGPDDPRRKDLEQINDATRRGAWLTRQLLAVSRKGMSPPRVLDLRAVVTDMDPMLRRLIGEHIDLVTVTGIEPGGVRIGEGQIDQVLLNLVVNAQDAMPNGGLVTIEVANVDIAASDARRSGGPLPGSYAMLAVRDNGAGMDAETRSHVFEPFFTTKDPGRGTGLGLSTVYGIVTQAGGHIEVESEPGCGTAVLIYLPRVAEALESDPAGPGEAQKPHRSETILLVEDDDDVRGMTREALESQGYTVLAASRGHEALEILKRHAGPVHLVVTDVVMPHMNGGELAQRLRAACRGIRVLFISGYTDDPAVRRDVLDAGAPFLQKPFDLEALARKVREVLDASLGDTEHLPQGLR